MNLLRFANPELLWLLLLIPAASLIRWFVFQNRRPVVRFSSLEGVRELTGGVRRRLRWLPVFLRIAAVAAVVIALARPQLGQGQVRTTTRGVAMMLVVDRSASMDEPFTFDGRELTKIDAVRDVVSRFVAGDGKALKGRQGDMIGLVTFAKFADTVCPLVRIHDTLVALVGNIQLVGATMNEPEAGTAIGEGLALGAARLRDVERELTRRSKELTSKALAGDVQADESFSIKSKVIVLLTDGEENMGEIRAADAARLCTQWGIKVYAIGVGASGPNRGMRQQRLANGMIVMRGPGGFDDRTLREIAELTGGKYFPANDPGSLERIYKEIDELEKTEIKTEEFTSYDEKFVPLVLFAAGLLAAEILLAATLLRRAP